MVEALVLYPFQCLGQLTDDGLDFLDDLLLAHVDRLHRHVQVAPELRRHSAELRPVGPSLVHVLLEERADSVTLHGGRIRNIDELVERGVNEYLVKGAHDGDVEPSVFLVA